MDAEILKNEITSDPSDSESWFLAELIELSTCETWDSHHVYINYVLLKAFDNESAFEKALRIGESYSVELRNSKDELIKVSCAGLRELFSLGPKLFEGLELFSVEETSVTSQALSKMITLKSELRTFRAETSHQSESDFRSLFDRLED